MVFRPPQGYRGAFLLHLPSVTFCYSLNTASDIITLTKIMTSYYDYPLLGSIQTVQIF